jgi:ribosomal protein S18 acetylase RimI-like enzyme
MIEDGAPIETSRFDEVVIRAARTNDIPDIVAIAEHWQLGADSRPDTAGFLVSGYGAAQYVELLTRARQFLVAVQGSKVNGFLVAYTDQAIKPDEILNLQVARELGPLIVIKQIAVAPGQRRQGIGRLLYERALSEAGDKPVIAVVVSDPPNVSSVRFHYAMGFEPYRTFSDLDGHERTVWLYRSRSPLLQLAQYQYAVDLYKHEDGLNWHKLNNLFYLSAALFTAYGVLLTVDSNASGFDRVDVLLFGVCMLGLAGTLAFELALTAGVYYVDARKTVVTRLEEQLVSHFHRGVGRPGSWSAGACWCST